MTLMDIVVIIFVGSFLALAVAYQVYNRKIQK